LIRMSHQVFYIVSTESRSDAAAMDFLKNWEPKKEKSKIKGPLKPQLDEAVKIIGAQMQHLDIRNARVQEYDKALFAKVVDFYHKRDIARAKIYANELTEVRKLLKIIMTTRLALEQISVRLTTVREYGDVAANLAPAIRAVNEISGGISNIVPEADMSMSQLGEILQGVMVDAAQGDPLTAPQFGSEDGSDILKQAAMIAEERIARTLPDVPKLDRHREMLEI